MASAAGLRSSRVVSESFSPAHPGSSRVGGGGVGVGPGEDGGLFGNVDSTNAVTAGQRGRPMQQSIKPRSATNRQCVVGAVTITSFALLVARLAFSFIVFDDTVVDDLGHLQYESVGSRLTLHEKGTNDSSSIALATNHGSWNPKFLQSGARHTHRSRTKPRIFARKAPRSLSGSSNCIKDEGIEDALGIVSQAYLSPQLFYEDFREMACKFKIFVYPQNRKGQYQHIFLPFEEKPTGNYASEHYFKMALMNSSFITTDPSKADLFFMPFSIARMRTHPKIGVSGIKPFVREYVEGIRRKYPFWNRTSGADHFFVNCHSIGRGATDEAPYIRYNAIQVVCSSSYYLQNYFPHKDATVPQIWPRSGFPKRAASIKQRKTLAFFAGAANSPLRAEVAKHWNNDSEIRVYTQRIDTPYSEALLTSKFCLHVKGFEVNTARLGDAMHYGCVPIIIAPYHDLPYNDVLDWKQFSVVVSNLDIPKLKKILKKIKPLEYAQMQSNVMQVRKHFEWHVPAQPFDAFYMVMYELWLRRHVVRFSLDDWANKL
ncbi:hypothetical protein Mapa_008602 [Marchantia paleacea]|nr:hypothetical protein Mapa_008602 [Marchantia paleacea]